mgnify:CR=1 FL=1
MKKLIATVTLISSLGVAAPIPVSAAIVDQVKSKVDSIKVDTKAIKATNSLTKKIVTETSHTANTIVEEIDALKGRLSTGVTPVELPNFLSESVRDFEKLLALVPREEIATFLGNSSTMNASNDGSLSLRPSSISTDCASGSPCEEFRKVLVNTLLDLSKVIELEIEEQTTEGEILPDDPSSLIQLEPLISFIQKVPGRGLFPAYMVMMSDSKSSYEELGNAICAHTTTIPTSRPFPLCRLRERTLEIQDIMRERRDARQATREESREESRNARLNAEDNPHQYPEYYYELQRCDNKLKAKPFALYNSLSFYAITVKGIAKLFIAMGETVLKETAVDGGVAAGPQISGSLQQNTPAMIGQATDGVADALLSMASSGKNKIRHCAELRAQLNIWDKVKNL